MYVRYYCEFKEKISQLSGSWFSGEDKVIEMTAMEAVSLDTKERGRRGHFLVALNELILWPKSYLFLL